MIRYSGRVQLDARRGGTDIGITFSLYAEEDSQAPLFVEMQNVRLDSMGGYTVLLGKNHAQGIPIEVFSGGQARWLGVKVEQEAEQPRLMLVSVPYALKAADAEMLGGKPLSAFVLQEGAQTTKGQIAGQANANEGMVIPAATVADGTANTLAQYDSTGTNLISSPVNVVNGSLAVGMVSPGNNVEMDVNGVIRSNAGIIVESPGARVRVHDTGVSSFWEFQPSAFVTDTFGFLRYENNAAVASKSFVMSSAGNLGVGTPLPGSKVTANGVIESLVGGFKFPDGSIQSTASATSGSISGSTSDQVVHVTQNGSGAGTLTISTLPTAVRGDATAVSGFISGILGAARSPDGLGVTGENLAVSGNAIGVFGVSAQSTTGSGVWGEAEATTGDAVGVFGRSFSTQGTGVFGQATASSGDTVGVYGRSDSTGGAGVWGNVTATSNAPFAVYGTAVSPSGVAGAFDVKLSSATILVGRVGTDPQSGAFNPVNVFRVDGSGRGYFNGGTQLSGADFAESVEARGGAKQYEPGDIMVIDVGGERQLALASEPYSKRVAGIYSTKPGVLATPHGMDDPRLATEVPLAVVGIVPCKVSAENGAIEPGDLLVSSATPGYAMKGTERERMLGAIVGKAMQRLRSGRGVVEVLVTLQ